MLETQNGTKYAIVLLNNVRSFKNENGERESDPILIKLWNGIAETVSNVSKVGDEIGVKGRIQTHIAEKEKRTYYNYEIIAEHISFKGE